MGKKVDQEFGSQVNLIQNENHAKRQIRNRNDVGGGQRPTTNSTRRSTRQNSIEFEVIRPEQKILTADEKVTDELFHSISKDIFNSEKSYSFSC